jgi:hypothetical protein
MQIDEITARIKEIQAEMQKKTEITVESLIKELEEIEELAKQPIHGKGGFNYDLTNWLKVKTEKAKLLGLYAPIKQQVDQNNTNNEIKIKITNDNN